VVTEGPVETDTQTEEEHPDVQTADETEADGVEDRHSIFIERTVTKTETVTTTFTRPPDPFETGDTTDIFDQHDMFDDSNPRRGE